MTSLNFRSGVRFGAPRYTSFAIIALSSLTAHEVDEENQSISRHGFKTHPQGAVVEGVQDGAAHAREVPQRQVMH